MFSRAVLIVALALLLPLPAFANDEMDRAGWRLRAWRVSLQLLSESDPSNPKGERKMDANLLPIASLCPQKAESIQAFISQTFDTLSDVSDEELHAKMKEWLDNRETLDPILKTEPLER